MDFANKAQSLQNSNRELFNSSINVGHGEAGQTIAGQGSGFQTFQPYVHGDDGGEEPPEERPITLKRSHEEDQVLDSVNRVHTAKFAKELL